MKRKVDVLLLITACIVGALFFLKKQKSSPKNEAATLGLFDEDFLKSLHRISFKGEFANFAFIEKQPGKEWLWGTENSKLLRPADLGNFLDQLNHIRLAASVDPDRVPKNFFSQDYYWQFENKDRKLRFYISKKKNLEGDLYLKKQEGNKLDIYLLDSSFEKALSPRLIRFVKQLTRFSVPSTDIVSIKTSYPIQFEKQNSQWRVKWKGNTIEIDDSVLQSAIAKLEAKELYPIENLSTENKLRFSLPQNNQPEDFWEFEYSDGSKKRFLIAEQEKSLSFIYDLEPNVIFRGFQSEDQFFLGSLGALLQMREYSLVALKEIDKLECRIGDKVLNYQYSDGYFRSKSGEFKMLDISQNLYNLVGNEISFDSMYREVLAIRFSSKNKLQYEFVIGKRGQDLVLHRTDKKYIYILGEISKVAIKNLINICEARNE
ncbi:MAG: hypothetical protein VX642_07215 [Bdellovibrionota bacterium]|nr:hypothetical protein [Bdellovibrionota bacterium]